MTRRISVVIPCKDRPEPLRRALDSVRRQTAPPWEVVVVDDGSDPPLVIEEDYPFPVRVVRQKNAGPSAARNRGAREATGDWIALLDSDDTWKPEKLEVQGELLDRHPEAGFCVCHRDMVGWTGFTFVLSPPDGVEAGMVPDALEQLVEDCCVPTSGVLFRRDVYLRIGGCDELLWYGEDWDLWLRLAAATPVVATRRRLTVYYHEDGSIFDHVARGDATVWLEKDLYVLGKVVASDLFDPATKARAAARLQEAGRDLAYFYRKRGRPLSCLRAAGWALRSGAALRPLLKHFLYCWPQSVHSLPRLFRRASRGAGGPRTEAVRRHILSPHRADLARQALGGRP